MTTLSQSCVAPFLVSCAPCLSKEMEMIGIRVRYMHPTNHRGSRWQATDGRNYLYASFQYEDEVKEKLALAIQFKLKFLPHSPELNPTPAQFNGDDYFAFYPKADQEKLEELLNQFEFGLDKLTQKELELIKIFVNRHCILK